MEITVTDFSWGTGRRTYNARTISVEDVQDVDTKPDEKGHYLVTLVDGTELMLLSSDLQAIRRVQMRSL